MEGGVDAPGAGGGGAPGGGGGSAPGGGGANAPGGGPQGGGPPGRGGGKAQGGGGGGGPQPRGGPPQAPAGGGGGYPQPGGGPRGAHSGAKVAAAMAPMKSPATPLPTATLTGWRWTSDGRGTGPAGGTARSVSSWVVLRDDSSLMLMTSTVENQSEVNLKTALADQRGAGGAVTADNRHLSSQGCTSSATENLAPVAHPAFGAEWSPPRIRMPTALTLPSVSYR